MPGWGRTTCRRRFPERIKGQWLQYHYTVRPEGEPPPTDAGDGTEYSAVNADVTEAFEQFSASKAAGDVLLIDATGTIVYSLDKRNDVGTSLTDGPYAGGALATAVTQDLPRVPFGTTILTDFTVSATGRAALYAVSAVRDGSRVLGALAVEIPVELLNSVTSADGNWEAVGLGEDGDAYIVASDLRLQSEPRAWLDDREGYLDSLREGTEDEQAQVDVIELFGSPAGIQVIDTEAVRAALGRRRLRREHPQRVRRLGVRLGAVVRRQWSSMGGRHRGAAVCRPGTADRLPAAHPRGAGDRASARRRARHLAGAGADQAYPTDGASSPGHRRR